MDIVEEKRGDVAILQLDGGLGYDNHREFADAVNRIIEQGAKHIVFDLERLVYLSSWGIGTLLSASAKVRKNNGNVILANVHREIVHILKVMRLVKIFDIQDSVDKAVAEIQERKGTDSSP